MKKHIPSYEDYLTESYASMLRSSAASLISDPRIRAAARNLVDELVGKGVNYAASRVDKSLGIQTGISLIDSGEFDKEEIESTEDSAEFVSTYMAKSVMKDIKSDVSDKSLRDILADLKDYFKRKLS
jgi:hypothetical protein